MQDVSGARLSGDSSVEIRGLEYDSRHIKPDSLFFAVKGFKVDGYEFVEQASADGAVAVMGERDGCEHVANHVKVDNIRQAMATVSARFYGFPGEKIKTCGITGTNGKTTTCYMVKKILEARGKTVGLVTTEVYDTGKELFKAERTTPESLDMQRLLFLMKKNYCVNAVIEASSHALMLNRLEHIDFRVAVYTNLTRDHLDFHKTMEDYLQAKALLLDKLCGAMPYVVINLDVPEFGPLCEHPDLMYIYYSIDNKSADIYCDSYEIRPNGTTMELVTPMGTRTINLKLPGRFNLQNAVAAAAAGMASGVDIDTVVVGLEAVEPVPGRFNYVDGGQPFAVYVDFAHTPDAIQRLCESAREITKGRLLILFGCGGDRDKGKRSMMGESAVNNADYVVVSSDNPRSEDPEAIIEDIKPGLSGSGFEIHIDRKDAVRAIMKKAQAGDVVLLAGKGSEPYQEIKGERFPYSDTDEALAALAEMGHQLPGEGRQV